LCLRRTRLSDVSAIVAGVKLPEWDRVNGVSCQSATRWCHAGVLLVPAWQLAAGTVLGGAPGRAAAGVAIYARVSSCGQRGDLGRQVTGLAGYLTAKGIAASKVVCEVGSGRNGHRTGLLRRLRDAWAGTVVAGHRECLVRFTVGRREAALGRKLIVAGQAVVSDDVVREMVEVVSSAKVHGTVARARADGLHKLTTRLAKSYPVVVVEDLNVAGMTASAGGSGHWRGKAGLNRAILDVAPAELPRYLGYKCSWYGSALVVADRWYPSSKTCSGCGWRKPSLPRSERMFCCGNTACGLVIDRDLNAALNLAALVRALVRGTASSGGNRPGDHLACAQGEERFTGSPGCSSVNCEDGTGRSRPGKTATVTRQRVTPEPAPIGSDR